ncbi:type I-E CRISPR-associated protein Cse1/CasA [Geoalkalibacter halelectricus]|uniref:type I-E CRISPR-associated protein Cse1/CasA n=1 Tax=Geoalkalibacter halelectricus TaxID=2847045 RepID=UPI003D1B924B
MNVAFDPWIPVVKPSGERILASLCNVLTEGENYADLAVRPHERVALMRLFLCAAHAALDGPKDYQEWKGAPINLPSAALKYLTEWKDSFELFHPEKPWMQIVGITKSKNQINNLHDLSDWTPASKLNFSFATGNTSILFDHGGMLENRSIDLCEIVISMVTYQCFSPGGLISQVFWNGKQTEKSSKDGPCVPASMVHALLRGENLVSSVCLNLLIYEDLHRHYPQNEIGKPVWEKMPTSFNDDSAIKNATTTYVGRLVPLTRLVHLHPSGEKMLLGDGLPYPTYIEGFPAEPTATVVTRKQNNDEVRTLVSYRPSKSFWRELGAIVVKRTAGKPGGPLSLIALQDDESCDLVVAALARNKASIIDTAESIFHVPSQLRVNAGAETYESEVRQAEGLAARLGWSIEIYRKEIDGGWEGRLKGAGPKSGELKAKLHTLATSHYWTSVEKNLALLMAHIEAIGTDEALPTREAWRKMLFATACDAYRIACSQETPRQMRAYVKGWQRLTSQTVQTGSDETIKEEES